MTKFQNFNQISKFQPNFKISTKFQNFNQLTKFQPIFKISKFWQNFKIDKISKLYVNQGPGSFAGIRNSLAVVKAIYIAKKIDYYCFSFDDFEKSNTKKYENIPNLCDKFKIKKNLIKPIYLS